MTHNISNSAPKIALYEPDIPQNTAAIVRTCSCLGAVLEIIEPCGFLFNDKRFKRVVMDYLDESMIKIYKSADEFFYKKKDDLISIFENNKIDPNKKIAFTCGSGITACVLGLTNSIISGRKPVVYDGSWTEYGIK